MRDDEGYRCENCWDILETEDSRLCDLCLLTHQFCPVCERVWDNTDLKAGDGGVDDFGCPSCRHIIPFTGAGNPGGSAPPDYHP